MKKSVRVSSPVSGAYLREWLWNSATIQGYELFMRLLHTANSMYIHRTSLTNQMSSRADSLDVKLLLYAIQKTTSFEKTLAQRFMQSPYMEQVWNDVCVCV